MITVVDTTEMMTTIEGMTADMIVVTMIRGMSAITVVIVTIETTEGGDDFSSDRSMITRFVDCLQRHGLPVIQA